MKAQELFVVERIEDAEQILELLQMSHPNWSGPSQSWGFRGQSDCAWQLVPSALRPSFKEYLPPSRRSVDATEDRAQNWNEFFAFEDFVKLADQIAIYIPGVEYLLRTDFEKQMRDISTDAWPLPDVVEGLAIAQHHGVPTRLIDFTYKPLAAAYFAVFDRYEKEKHGFDFRGASFSVWGINLLYLRNAWPNWESRRLQIVEVPTSRNPFLNAQMGFFLYDTAATQPGPPKPIDEVIVSFGKEDSTWDLVEKRLRTGVRKYAGPPIIRKFDIASSEAAKLLQMLFERERISRAHLMPSMDNVVATYAFMRDLTEKA